MKMNRLQLFLAFITVLSTLSLVWAQEPRPSASPSPSPKIGFTQQGFKPSPLDPLGTLILTDDEKKVSDEELSLLESTSGLRRYYDRFEDKTTVLTTYERLYPHGDTYHSLEMLALFVHAGKTAHQVKDIRLAFRSKADDWIYLKSNKLFAIADGERITLGSPIARESNISQAYRDSRIEELLEYRITNEQLMKLATSRSVEMRLGNDEFRLFQSVRDSLRLLASRLPKPSTVKTARPRQRRSLRPPRLS